MVLILNFKNALRERVESWASPSGFRRCSFSQHAPKGTSLACLLRHALKSETESEVVPFVLPVNLKFY